ncbi:hypothetical protein BT69DRAFT_1330566 [Atractiella rhizophila]|nr:hypothetical protein BT69DRAFT_1330566 [Atractiella rhizophila]
MLKAGGSSQSPPGLSSIPSLTGAGPSTSTNLMLSHLSPSQPSDPIKRSSTSLDLPLRFSTGASCSGGAYASSSWSTAKSLDPNNLTCSRCHSEGVKCYWITGIDKCVPCAGTRKGCSRKKSNGVSTSHGSSPARHLSPHPTRPSTSIHIPPSPLLRLLRLLQQLVNSMLLSHSALSHTNGATSASSSMPHSIANSALEGFRVRVPSVGPSAPGSSSNGNNNDPSAFLEPQPEEDANAEPTLEFWVWVSEEEEG